MSGTARGLLDGRFSARSLGSFPLKDFDAPEPLYQLQADGLAERFPRPRVTPRRSHRKLILIGAAIIGLLIAAAVAAVIVSRSGAGAASLVDANNVGVIDPATNKVVDRVPVGNRPGPVAFGSGSVWVGNIEDRNLTRLDAAKRTNAGLVTLDDQTPTGIAYGEREGLWVAHGLLGGLSKVDPQFGQVTDTMEIGGRSSEGVGEVAVGVGSVWAVLGSRRSRVWTRPGRDSRTSRSRAPTPGPSPSRTTCSGSPAAVTSPCRCSRSTHSTRGQSRPSQSGAGRARSCTATARSGSRTRATTP